MSYVPVDNTERDGTAIEVLQSYHAAGQLQIPQPWINDKGELFCGWDEERDGDALACFMDILGLNGRYVVENTSLTAAQRNRERAMARDSSVV